MSNYKRLRIPGATYFFTVNLARRGDTTLVDHIDALREAYAQTKAERPFRCDAMVVLPGSFARGLDIAVGRRGFFHAVGRDQVAVCYGVA